MATAFPAGWHTSGGTIGTDYDFTTAQGISGGGSVHLIASPTVGVSLISNWIPVPDSADQTVSTQYYFINVAVRASSVAANKDVQVVYEVYNATKSTLVSSGNIHNGTLNTANTWEMVGESVIPSGGRWLRVYIKRPSDLDFDLYVDHIEVKQFPAGGFLTRSAGGTFGSSWTTVNMSAGGVWGYGEDDTANNILYTHVAGFYQVIASVEMDDAYADGDMFGIRINVHNNAGTIRGSYYGQVLTLSSAYTATTNYMGLQFSATMRLYPKPSSSGRSCGLSVDLIQYTNTGSLKDYGYVELLATRVTDR